MFEFCLLVKRKIKDISKGEYISVNIPDFQTEYW